MTGPAMDAVVIDTNVLLIANGSHDGFSQNCRDTCVQRLLQRQRAGVVVIDDASRILGEYSHKTRPNQPKGVGDAFLKWLLQNQANRKRVHRVSITPTYEGRFAEFPDASLQERFDPPDRKFVAVAHAHPGKPPILQAGDSKWLDWWQALERSGIRVDFLCPNDVRAVYVRKFPDRPPPPLPTA
jgi:predicted nucleic acid-binding protein